MENPQNKTSIYIFLDLSWLFLFNSLYSVFHGSPREREKGDMEIAAFWEFQRKYQKVWKLRQKW